MSLVKLEVQNISKSYKQVQALHEISFTLTPGIYGLLGPNGAGKSTLIRILIQSLKPDQGKILWNGQVIRKNPGFYLQNLGYVPQVQALYPEFTPWQYLDYMSALKEIPRKETQRKIEEVLKMVELEDCRNMPIKAMSGGMKQRLLIAQSLLNHPQILILDEPTTGLDPRQRILLKEILHRMAKNTIILLATHLVSDLESIADEILLLRKGILLKKEKPKVLFAEIPEKETEKPFLSELEKVYLYYFEEEEQIADQDAGKTFTV